MPCLIGFSSRPSFSFSLANRVEDLELHVVNLVLALTDVQRPQVGGGGALPLQIQFETG